MRDALLRVHHHSVRHHHLGCQHPLDEHEETPVPDLRLQPRRQPLMVNAVEELFEIEIDDPFVPVFQIRRGLGDGRVTTAPWAEAMARWMKGRFPVRAEYAEHRLLNPPIDHIGNTKAALAASGLRNPDPANHARAIGSVEQVTTKHGELENRDVLKRRIEEASRFVDVDQLCLSPQCGFSSTFEGNDLTFEQQVAKLRLIVEVAEEVWGA